MASVSAYGRHERDIKLGVVAPHALAERVMLSALPVVGEGALPVVSLEAELGLRRRLVMAPYVNESEAPEKAARLGRSVDACLFAGRLPLEYARRAGALSCPATCVELGEAALARALLTAQRDGIDPELASFDGISRSELTAGLTALGLRADATHLRNEVAGPGMIASFHERLWRLGQTSAAFTCLDQVARRLEAAGVPIVRLAPTDRAISSALQVATLLAYTRLLADSQLAVALVEVPALREGARRAAPRQAREELRLTVHRFLLREAQRIEATVSHADEHTFLIFGTRAGLPPGDPPFAARARTALGVALEVGVGTGRSVHEAEARARLALTAGTSRAATAPVGSRASQAAWPAARAAAGETRLSTDSLSRLRALEVLSRLAHKLADGTAPVVDAETTGVLLAVTPRTARRQLRALVDEGLALPLPPARRQHPGRPRLAYRLVVEKLDQRAAE